MKNRNLLIIILVMLVNNLGFGIIIPLMYPYATRFGISASGMSLLFVTFSLAQFLATPVIGRLSDKYGRKPLLIISLFGTGLSLVFFASATSAIALFVARSLDGITGGNVSVAQAIIADTTKEKERAKYFGILGAVFGFGFVLGPLIGGLLSNISLTAPFWFAATLAFFGVLLSIVFLEETNKTKKVSKEKLFDVSTLYKAIFKPLTGTVLVLSFMFLVAMNAMIIGFQTYTVDNLELSPYQIGIIFTLFGIISVIMQGFGIRYLLQKFSKKFVIVITSLLVSSVLMFSIALTSGFVTFLILVLAYGAVSAPITPITTAFISERTKAEDQGGMLGINQAYGALAQIFGPLIAGVLVLRSTDMIFLFVAVVLLLAIYPAFKASKNQYKAKFDM